MKANIDILNQRLEQLYSGGKIQRDLIINNIICTDWKR